jgi:hypothetical protein
MLCNILISGKIIKELSGLVGSGTPVYTTLNFLSFRRSSIYIYDISRIRVKINLQEVGCGGMDWIELA